MKKKIRLSIILQIGLLFTFCLPFFPSGCEGKKVEEAPAVDSTSVDTAVVAIDSTSNYYALSDSTVPVQEEVDTLNTATLDNSNINSDDSESTHDNRQLSERLSKKSKIAKTILRPNNNYTGIATLIDSIEFLPYGLGLGIAFILWTLSLIIKIKDFNNIFILNNIIGTILLSFTHTSELFGDEKRLWGFWICLILSIIMTIYDFILLIKIYKKQKNTCA